jgi:colanic acid/amylovoran biosynthesis protein
MGTPMRTANRGVSALGASLVKLVRGAEPGVEVFMLIGSQDQQPVSVMAGSDNILVPVVNYRVTPKATLRQNLFWIAFIALVYRALPITWLREKIVAHCPWIKAVRNAHVIGDIRGGDSFSDIYGLRSYLLASLSVMTVIWVRGDIVLFPQTYGPYKRAVTRMVARYILRRSSWILSRDQEGMETVRKLIGPTEKVRYCPDVAFALDAARPAVLPIAPPLPVKSQVCLVGLNINGLMFNGGYSRHNMFGLKLDYRSFLEQLMSRLLEKESLHVLLVPHNFARTGDVESDPDACGAILRSVPESARSRVHMVTEDCDQNKIKGIIGECDFFIGSRMHSCIAALSQGIPAVGVAYSKKFIGVFESVGASDWVVDGRQSDENDAISLIFSGLEQRDRIRERLAGKAEDAQRILRETFASLLSREATVGHRDE